MSYFCDTYLIRLTQKFIKTDLIMVRREGKMFGKILLLFAVFGLSFNGYSNLSVEGHYQGKNVYVQSPESEDGFGFCINKVLVNGEVSDASYQSSAFQIDLTQFDIAIGDPVMIVLEHEEGCKPKLLNPEVLLPKSTFILNDISCTPEGDLTWTTTNESGVLTYSVEQYKWNKWVTVGEVNGLGSEDINEYHFEVSPHSGENKIRVTQTDITGKKRISKEITFFCDQCKEPNIKQKNKVIVFETEDGKIVITKYEVFDAYGNIVKKGMNSMIDCSNLKKGIYHINYDNKYEKIINK